MQTGRLRYKEYKDLSIHIYPNEVKILSHDGESSGTLRLSLNKDEVQKALNLASQTSKGYATRGIESSQLDPIRDIGMQLFSALFEGSRMTTFQTFQNAASNEGNSIRLRLRIEDPDLISLPWEFMHDGTSFLSLSPRFSIVRTPLRQNPSFSMNIDSHNATMLIVALGIGDFMNKKLDNEIARLTELLNNGPISTIVMKNPTLIEFENIIKTKPIHILQYFGETVYIWNDKKAKQLLTDKIEGTQNGSVDYLKHLLSQISNLRLVCLSTQYSERLAEELSKDIPAVIGMRQDACDDVIFTFTEGLYRGICNALTIEEAFMQGRQEIDHQSPGSREWGLPILYLGTSDSVFFKEPEDQNISENQTSVTLSTGGSLTGVTTKKLEGISSKKVRELKKLQARLNIQQINYEVLLKKQGSLGSVAPPYIHGEIEDTNREIKNLTKKLNDFKGKIKL